MICVKGGRGEHGSLSPERVGLEGWGKGVV